MTYWGMVISSYKRLTVWTYVFDDKNTLSSKYLVRTSRSDPAVIPQKWWRLIVPPLCMRDHGLKCRSDTPRIEDQNDHETMKTKYFSKDICYQLFCWTPLSLSYHILLVHDLPYTHLPCTHTVWVTEWPLWHTESWVKLRIREWPFIFMFLMIKTQCLPNISLTQPDLTPPSYHKSDGGDITPSLKGPSLWVTAMTYWGMVKLPYKRLTV